MGQLIQDLKLIISNDKRWWAVGGFIVVVLVIWGLTDSWRPPKEVPVERTVKVTEEAKVFKNAASEGMVQDISSLSVTNEKLKNDISRVSEELRSKQEEISWQMDGLISRLGSINSTIDDITQKIGAKKVESLMKEDRLRPRKPRKTNSN